MKITGKDLIMFILEKDLVNEVLGDERTIQKIFLSTEEAAVKIGISTSSLLDMAKIGIVDSVEFGGKKYFSKDINLSSLGKRKEEL